MNTPCHTLDTLVRETAIDYLKWEMNRPIAEPTSPAVAAGGTVQVEHVRRDTPLRFRFHVAMSGLPTTVTP